MCIQSQTSTSCNDNDDSCGVGGGDGGGITEFSSLPPSTSWWCRCRCFPIKVSNLFSNTTSCTVGPQGGKVGGGGTSLSSPSKSHSEISPVFIAYTSTFFRPRLRLCTALHGQYVNVASIVACVCFYTTILYIHQYPTTMVTITWPVWPVNLLLFKFSITPFV